MDLPPKDREAPGPVQYLERESPFDSHGKLGAGRGKAGLPCSAFPFSRGAFTPLSLKDPRPSYFVVDFSSRDSVDSPFITHHLLKIRHRTVGSPTDLQILKSETGDERFRLHRRKETCKNPSASSEGATWVKP